jgi:hypothetical protein
MSLGCPIFIFWPKVIGDEPLEPQNNEAENDRKEEN